MCGMTQQEVATAAKIERVTYTNIELGNKSPSFAVAARIKKALGYHDDNIFWTWMSRMGTRRLKKPRPVWEHRRIRRTHK